jgi:hypothetical protein
MPCAWVFDNLCDACVVEKPGTNALFPKECRFCDNLINDWLLDKQIYTCCVQETEDDENFYFRMSAGKWVMNWFAWSGFWKPNKTVAAAQRHCPYFMLSEFAGTKHISGKGRIL